MEVISVSELCLDGGKSVIMWALSIVLDKVPLTPTSEKIKDLLQEAVDQIKDQVKSMQEARFKAAIYSFTDGCFALKEVMDITDICHPDTVMTAMDSSSRTSGNVKMVQKILERAMEKFKKAENQTGKLIHDSKNLEMPHRLTAWKVHLKCLAINSISAKIAARSWEHRLSDLANTMSTDLLARYMLGEVKENWYRRDKDLMRACEEWRCDIARMALCSFGTAGEPKSSLRSVITRCIEDLENSTEKATSIATLSNWLGILPKALKAEKFKEQGKAVFAVLCEGFWIQISDEGLVTVLHKDGDTSAISKAVELRKKDMGIIWRPLSVNRANEKLFEALVSTGKMLVKFQVDKDDEGKAAVTEAGSRKSDKDTAVFAFYLPLGKVLVEIKCSKTRNLLGHWIYDSWDAIPDPVVASGNKLTAKNLKFFGAVVFDSMIYFIGVKTDPRVFWLVPETETDRHREFQISDATFVILGCYVYQPCEQLVVIQEVFYKGKLMVIDMKTRTVVYRSDES